MLRGMQRTCYQDTKTVVKCTHTATLPHSTEYRKVHKLAPSAIDTRPVLITQGASLLSTKPFIEKTEDARGVLWPRGAPDYCCNPSRRLAASCFGPLGRPVAVVFHIAAKRLDTLGLRSARLCAGTHLAAKRLHALDPLGVQRLRKPCRHLAA